MAYRQTETIDCDVLVLGSGIAGLLLAHDVAQANLSVVLACKGQLIDSNTSRAQGGLAAVTGTNPLDNPELHLQDTLSSGAGLTDQRVARLIVGDGKRLVERLVQLGVAFDRSGASFDAALEGGHSRPRVLHSKDASGRAIATALIQTLVENPRAQVLENTFACDLLLNDQKCVGATLIKDGHSFDVSARHTVLATGGLGQVFARTTNPLVATGDGIAMAYRAGARLIDMEFVQFHPTAFARTGAPASLISEAVRGAGAHLVDDKGERFAFRFHKSGELATRDIVARGIFTTMHERQLQNVWLDMRPIGTDRVTTKFPNIIKACRELGIDPLQQPVPVSPAAHYFMGGIWSDDFGRTTVPNLYAIGECASTGLHGANRLASNSLLEGGVMAMRLSEVICSSAMQQQAKLKANRLNIVQAPYAVPRSLEDFRKQMFDLVGLSRSEEQLNRLINSLPESLEYRVPADRPTAEKANMALLGWLIARAAVERRESRGAHFRSDFPQSNDRRFKRRLYLSRVESGWLPVGQHMAALAGSGTPAAR